MSERKRIRVLLVGEFEVRGQDPLGSAAAQLDAFREAVQPATEYGLTLYQATAADLAELTQPGNAARGIDPAPTGFWQLLGRRANPG